MEFTWANLEDTLMYFNYDAQALSIGMNMPVIKFASHPLGSRDPSKLIGKKE